MDKEILINIGNTHAQFAIFDGETVNLTETVPTSELSKKVDSLQTICENPQLKIFIASVVPKTNEQLTEILKDRELFFLTAEAIKNINFDKVDKTTIGGDRLANIVAAAKTLQLPAIVIDCGTAITTEIIDQEKNFLGGAIIPGRKLWRKALNLHTGQLPEVELTTEGPSAIGTTTAEALKAMDCAVVGAVEKLIEKSLETIKDGKVYFTGGDADFFAKQIDGEKLPENFTLLGLAEIARQLR